MSAMDQARWILWLRWARSDDGCERAVAVVRSAAAFERIIKSKFPEVEGAGTALGKAFRVGLLPRDYEIKRQLRRGLELRNSAVHELAEPNKEEAFTTVVGFWACCTRVYHASRLGDEISEAGNQDQIALIGRWAALSELTTPEEKRMRIRRLPKDDYEKWKRAMVAATVRSTNVLQQAFGSMMAGTVAAVPMPELNGSIADYFASYLAFAAARVLIDTELVDLDSRVEVVCWTELALAQDPSLSERWTGLWAGFHAHLAPLCAAAGIATPLRWEEATKLYGMR